MLAVVQLSSRLFLYLILCSAIAGYPSECLADQSKLKSAIDGLLASADKQTVVSVQVIDLKTGEEVYSRKAKEPLKPASTLKILTTVTALEELGSEYYYQTPFLINFKDKNSAPDLYVKGVGDPYMTTEFLWIAARKIKKLGVTDINQIFIDDTAFKDPPARQGQRAYMTGASAMAFNFNSISVDVCPNLKGGKASVSADPWESDVYIINDVDTVLKGVSSVSVEELPAGRNEGLARFKVNGKIALGDGCKVISRSINNPGSYFANTLAGFLKYLGIKINNTYSMSVFPVAQGRLFTQPTFPLSYIIKGLNHYSTNFIAEQILYTLGADEERKSFDRVRGIGKIEALIAKLGFDSTQYSIHDGSGLSHDNRLTTEILTRFLQHAYNQVQIKNEFIVSLPIAGISGTLRKRGFDTSQAMIRAKTGSLDGVNSLAGYIFSNNQKHYAFAILQNQVKSREIALNLEEKIVDVIAGN